MHGVKGAILAIFQFWPNGTFEPVHGIQIFLDQKISCSVTKMTFTNNIPNMSQGPPNPGFRSVRVENRFSQKGLTRFQKFFLIWVKVHNTNRQLLKLVLLV